MHSDYNKNSLRRASKGSGFSLVSEVLILPLSVLAWIVVAAIAAGCWTALTSLMRLIF
jgi:hypothetical protein